MARASPVLEAEEHPAVPARAGDGAGDGGERLVGPALILEVVVADRDAVLDALPFADQPRAGDRPVLAAAGAGSPDRRRRVPRRALAAASASRASARRRPVPGCDRRAGFRGSAGCRAAARVSKRSRHCCFSCGIGSVFSAASGPERYRSLHASILEDVGMTALVGGTVERTFSEVGR